MDNVACFGQKTIIKLVYFQNSVELSIFMSIIRVSVSEAARLFGVSEKTIRKALTAKELTYIVVRGRYKINFQSLVKWSQKSTRRKNQLANDGIGQFVTDWNISNRKYSPSSDTIQKKS